jgi:hypothetical protein
VAERTGTHTTINVLWHYGMPECLTDTLTDVGHPVTDQDSVVNTMLLIFFQLLPDGERD